MLDVHWALVVLAAIRVSPLYRLASNNFSITLCVRSGNYRLDGASTENMGKVCPRVVGFGVNVYVTSISVARKSPFVSVSLVTECKGSF